MNGSAELRTPLGLVNRYEIAEPVSVSDWLSNHPIKGPFIVLVNNEPILRAEWDDTLINQNDNAAFIALPARGRGVAKTIVGLVAMVALAVAAPYAAGVIGPVIGITGTTGLGLLSAGIFTAGTFVLNAILPASTAANQQNQEVIHSPTYSLQPSGNAARLLSAIPKLYGNFRVVPDYIATPWFDFQGNFQVVRAWYALGLGSYRIEQVYIGETLFWDQNTGYNSATFPLSSIEVLSPGSPVTSLYPHVYTSPEVAGFKLYAGITIGPYVVVPPGMRTNQLQYDFTFEQGLSFTSQTNPPTTSAVSVAFNLIYRQIDDSGNPIGGFVLHPFSYSGLSYDPVRISTSITVPLGRYEVACVRTSSSLNIVSFISDVSWTTVKAFLVQDSDGEVLSTVWSEGTTLAVIMTAGNKISTQSAHNISVVATSILPEYDPVSKEWGAPVPTRKIAAMVSDVIKARYGAGLTDGRIDLDKLWGTLQPTWDARGDYCDRIFDNKMSIWDTLTAILKCGRARPVFLGSKISFVRDEPRALARGLFTPANSKDINIEYVMQDNTTPDDIIIQFFNRNTWKADSVRCSISQNFTANPVMLDYTGLTTRAQAWREGYYQAGANKYRRKFPQFVTELEARLLVLGDLIQIAHDVPQWGQFSTLKTQDAYTFTAEDEFTWSDGVQHFAIMSCFNGSIITPCKVSRGATNDIIIFDATDLNDALMALSLPLSAAFVSLDDDRGRVMARITFGPSTAIATNCLVIGTQPNADLTINVAAVNDDPRVHTAETLYAVPPELQIIQPIPLPLDYPSG